MDRARVESFIDEYLRTATGMTTFAVLALADRIGLLRALAAGEWMTVEELASTADLDARMVESILATLAAARFVAVEDGMERFRLPPEHAVVLVSEDSPLYLAGWLDLLPAAVERLPELEAAVREGSGVPLSSYDPRVVAGMDRLSGPGVRRHLVGTWLAEMPDVVERLRSGASVLDVGCGAGNAAIVMARAFPDSFVTGIDVDARAVQIARRKADLEEVSNVAYEVADAGDVAGQFDLITSFDVIHDLPDPLGALTSIRRALTRRGVYLMVEPAVEEDPSAQIGDTRSELLHGIGTLFCIPQSLAMDGPGLGPAWGETAARSLCHEAGFGEVTRLDLNPDHGAFYRVEA